MSELNIYVLRCKKGKYYIGKSKNIVSRLNQHNTGHGSAWTKKYPPIEIVENIENCDKFDEDKYTLKYMEKYGIENVRGGSYVQIELNSEQLNSIKNQLDSANDRCHNCGEEGHFIRRCPYKIKHQNDGIIKNIGESLINLSSWLWGDEKVKNKKKKRRKGSDKRKKCFRCGNVGHFVDKCYATYHIDGHKISNPTEN